MLLENLKETDILTLLNTAFHALKIIKSFMEWLDIWRVPVQKNLPRFKRMNSTKRTIKGVIIHIIGTDCSAVNRCTNMFLERIYILATALNLDILQVWIRVKLERICQWRKIEAVLSQEWEHLSTNYVRCSLIKRLSAWNV